MKNNTVGFIGLGNMGLPMVLNLLKSGIKVHVYDVPEQKNLEVAKKAGASWEHKLENVGKCAPILISMLPSGEVLREVLFGPCDLKAHLQPKATLIDMSTSNPAHTRLTHQELASLGISMIDAPVMGGVPFAKDASLDILVGGSRHDIDRCKYLFDALGRSLTYCGVIGSGHALKALTNYINATAMINAVEAISIGKRFGVDEQVMVQSLVETCTGRNHPILKKVIPKILTKTYDSGMAISLLEKDLNIAMDIAIKTNSEHLLMDRVLELWRVAVAELGEGVDQTEIAKLWDK